MFKQVLTIDGRPFDVGVSGIKRSATIQDGQNEGTAKDYTWIRDVRGTLYDYTVTFNTSAGLTRTDYDDLYYLISAPVEFHTIEVPFGQTTLTFTAGVKTVSDEVIAMDDGTIWGKLAMTFKPKSPQRLPEEVSNGV